MPRLTLRIDALQVQSFAVNDPSRPMFGGESYPDCPTATGCTCVEACATIVTGTA